MKIDDTYDMCMYIYIYGERGRERDVYIYIYIYIYIYVCLLENQNSRPRDQGPPSGSRRVCTERIQGGGGLTFCGWLRWPASDEGLDRRVRK